MKKDFLRRIRRKRLVVIAVAAVILFGFGMKFWIWLT